MSTAVPYTKKQLVQRILKHVSDGFPNASTTVSYNQVLLYIDQALAYSLIGSVYANAKLEGSLAVPEAWIFTYQLTALQQDAVTNYWYSTLPQPPLSLPLGYSVNRVYFANAIDGIGNDALPIKAKRLGYRNNMPMPFGVRYWVEGNKIWLAASNGTSLLNQNCYVQMPITRTMDIDEDLNLPDDQIEAIFNNVVMKINQRLQEPKDVVLDNLPSGNKSS